MNNNARCPKCGGIITSQKKVATSATDELSKLSCGHEVWGEDISRFNSPSGRRSLRYGCFDENLIPSGERVRIFTYISFGAKIEEMLFSLGYRMVSEELPNDREMEEEDGSYPVRSGEQIWIRGMSTAYVNRQYCGESSFRGNAHIAVVGIISDWKKIASLIEKHQEREERNRGRGWHILTGKWGRWVWLRRATHESFARDPQLVEESFEATEGFRRIFGQV